MENHCFGFWPRGYKNIMLISAEHEILNSHKDIDIKKFSHFLAMISLEYLILPAH